MSPKLETRILVPTTTCTGKGATLHTKCNATSKGTGKPCPLAPVPGKTRCKWHGGKSTGPRTEDGKQAARENGKKGGRPRKQTDPVPEGKDGAIVADTGTSAGSSRLGAESTSPNPVTISAVTTVTTLGVKCEDCEHYSAAYHCRAAERGELGPDAALHPKAMEARECSGFQASVYRSFIRL